jgi:hypothetical protein
LWTAICPISGSGLSVHCLFNLFGFFFAWEGSVSPGGYVGLSQGWLGEYCVALGAYLFGLLNVSQERLETGSGGTEPSCFLSVTWHEEAFYRSGVHVVKVLTLPGTLFLPSVPQCLSEGFDSRSSCCLLHALVAILYHLTNTFIKQFSYRKIDSKLGMCCKFSLFKEFIEKYIQINKRNKIMHHVCGTKIVTCFQSLDVS